MKQANIFKKLSVCYGCLPVMSIYHSFVTFYVLEFDRFDFSLWWFTLRYVNYGRSE